MPDTLQDIVEQLKADKPNQRLFQIVIRSGKTRSSLPVRPPGQNTSGSSVR